MKEILLAIVSLRSWDIRDCPALWTPQKPIPLLTMYQDSSCTGGRAIEKILLAIVSLQVRILSFDAPDAETHICSRRRIVRISYVPT